MEYRLIAKNQLRTDRYITCIGLSSSPLIEVDLVVEQDGHCSFDYEANVDELREIFYEHIGDCWDRGVLVQDGQEVDVPYEPIICVDFNPTLENIAKAVYKCLDSIIYKKLHVALKAVVCKTAIAEIVYEGKHHHHHDHCQTSYKREEPRANYYQENNYKKHQCYEEYPCDDKYTEEYYDDCCESPYQKKEPEKPYTYRDQYKKLQGTAKRTSDLFNDDEKVMSIKKKYQQYYKRK